MLFNTELAYIESLSTFFTCLVAALNSSLHSILRESTKDLLREVDRLALGRRQLDSKSVDVHLLSSGRDIFVNKDV